VQSAENLLRNSLDFGGWVWYDEEQFCFVWWSVLLAAHEEIYFRRFIDERNKL